MLLNDKPNPPYRDGLSPDKKCRTSMRNKTLIILFSIVNERGER